MTMAELANGRHTAAVNSISVEFIEGVDDVARTRAW